MYKEDDLLEEALNKAEVERDKSAGTPEVDEISSLVNLAASIRDLPHPEQAVETTRAEKRRIQAAAKNKRQKQRSFGWSRNGGFTGQWMVLPAVAGAALLVLMVFVLAAGAGLYFSGPRGAHAATLTSGSGVVEVLDANGSDGWTAVSEGQRVKSGQRLRTGADSQVTLTFFEGTQVTMDPNTDLVLSKVAGDWGKKLQVSLIQNEGETSHQVVPLQGVDSAYIVMTPSGEAYVRGTSFKVLVEETGDAVFSVDSGAVLVSNNGEETFLAAGQGVITALGEPLAAPTFLFALQGELQQKLGKTWVVEGVNITLRGSTRIDGNPQENGMVLVTGRISKKGEWIADSIIALDSQDKFGTFTGVVTGVSEGGVEINGYPFVILDEQPEVNVKDLVRVQFEITDGTWVVLNLEVLDGGDASEPDSEPAPDTEEPDEPDEPETDLYFEDEEDKVATCGQAGPFENTLFYVSEDKSAPALDVSLVATVEEEPDSLVSQVLIEPDTFNIQPSLPDQSESTAVPFTVTVELTGDIPPGGEIEVKIELKDESTGEFTGDIYKVKLECDKKLPEEEDLDGDGDKCTRDGYHPHALTLYEEYVIEYGIPDVDYEKIWRWFCEDNLGFGEIELAFKLFLVYGEATGYTVLDIIDKRLVGGLGWGQIKQELKQAERVLLVDEAPAKKVPPGKEKSEEAKNKDKPKKKDD
jgi:hypothetical protein